MKKILVILVALFTVVPLFAQSDDGEEDISAPVKERKNAFFVGPKIGGTLTSMTDPDEGKLYDKSGIGFSGGLAMKARFGKASDNSVGGTGYWGIGLELKYKKNTVKTIAMDEEGNENANFSMDYFEVPVYLQIYPFAKSATMNSLYVELGASIAGTMSRSPKTLSLNNPSVEFSKITYDIDNNGSKLKGGDVRPLVGLGYTIPNTGLDINARYYIGMSKLAENFNCKMNTFEVSLAWMFNICKF